MKNFLLIFLIALVAQDGLAQGVDKRGQLNSNPTGHVNKHGAIGAGGLSKYGANLEVTIQNANALSFDGSNDFAALLPGVYFNGDFTAECWVYPRSFGTWARILDFGNGAYNSNVVLAYTMNYSGKVAFHTYIDGSSKEMTAPNTLPLNQWSHIAVTLNGTTGTIYVNGIAVSTAQLYAPAHVIRNNAYIGKSNWPDAYANAIFDEFRIWNKARSASEILESMNTELAGNEPGLVVYYNFNQGEAGADNAGITTLADHSGNGHHATLNNFSLNGSISNWVDGAPVSKYSDGSSPAKASSSAFAIKQSVPNAQDGYYWIKNANINAGAPFQIYADMTTDGGGWTLIMCNKNPNSGWTNANAVLRNQTSPSNNANYSIIAWADYIKKGSTGFQYMMDANTRRNYGGIWTVNQPYSFTSKSNGNTDITINTKFGNWNYFEGGGFGPRMPWWTNQQTTEGFITTSLTGTSHWWGTLIAGSGWGPSPWLSGENGTLNMQAPGIIWYWVR